jgi:hypothetical protein
MQAPDNSSSKQDPTQSVESLGADEVSDTCQDISAVTKKHYLIVTTTQYWQNIESSNFFDARTCNDNPQGRVRVSGWLTIGEVGGKTLLLIRRTDLRDEHADKWWDDEQEDSDDEDQDGEEEDDCDEASLLIAVRCVSGTTNEFILLAQLGGLIYEEVKQSSGSSVPFHFPVDLMLTAEVAKEESFIGYWLLSTKRVAPLRYTKQDRWRIPCDAPAAAGLAGGTGEIEQSVQSPFSMAKIKGSLSEMTAENDQVLKATECITEDIEGFSVRRVGDQLEPILPAAGSPDDTKHQKYLSRYSIMHRHQVKCTSRHEWCFCTL